jgi:hypothetical protein
VLKTATYQSGKTAKSEAQKATNEYVEEAKT